MTGPAARPRECAARSAEHEEPFAEPWQATAFALAVHLSERGAVPWSEWSAALAREIQAARDDPVRLDGYYEHWLRALERLCAAKGMVDPAEIRTRQEEWRRAYLDTPHGEPVELEGSRPPASSFSPP
jgi:nitrile hydratase accessory protein